MENKDGCQSHTMGNESTGVTGITNGQRNLNGRRKNLFILGIDFNADQKRSTG